MRWVVRALRSSRSNFSSEERREQGRIRSPQADARTILTAQNAIAALFVGGYSQTYPLVVSSRRLGLREKRKPFHFGDELRILLRQIFIIGSSTFAVTFLPIRVSVIFSSGKIRNR
jgi:hypothetical protein